MKSSKFFMLASLLLFSFTTKEDFLSTQKKYERVRTAISEKSTAISQNLKQKNIKQSELNILFVAYKKEKKLKLYAKSKTEKTYRLLTEYTICASSGDLGPKRKKGDNQVPEGFYHINRYNPASNFHLSLGLNYPNEADKKKSTAKDLGGDIFIHGSCVTIGCLPMTDDKIKEIYLYAVYAHQAGQSKIPVYIFPFEMTKENLDTYQGKYKDFTEFWKNLKQGFDKFEKEKKELKFSVDKNGDYIL